MMVPTVKIFDRCKSCGREQAWDGYDEASLLARDAGRLRPHDRADRPQRPCWWMAGETGLECRCSKPSACGTQEELVLNTVHHEFHPPVEQTVFLARIGYERA